jgi:hypothetical protein
MLQNKNIKIVFKTLIGLLLFLWMGYSLFNQIRHQPNLKNTLTQLVESWSRQGMFYFALVIVLMAVNWLIEAFKWRLLLRGTEQFSLLRALQSVLTGVAVSLITPNRIGEYMGRILYLRNVNKIQGVTVTIIGSFAQLIVTGFLGLVGLSYYLPEIKNTVWLDVLFACSVLLCAGLVYFYFHLFKIIGWVSSVSFLKKMVTYLEIVRRFDQRQLIRILLLSLVRYMVYATQFFMLLKLFLVEANSLDLIFTIWLIFWAMAIVPTIAIAEIGIRGETALFFLLPLSTNQLGIVSSTLLLWLINLIIPALIGCLFVYKIKIYGDE